VDAAALASGRGLCPSTGPWLDGWLYDLHWATRNLVCRCVSGLWQQRPLLSILFPYNTGHATVCMVELAEFILHSSGFFIIIGQITPRLHEPYPGYNAGPLCLSIPLFCSLHSSMTVAYQQQQFKLM
jgi:hypothetical protein